MSNKMLIDATHPEETRVVVLRGNRVEEFDFEAADRQQLRGNIYLAKVTRVEPSLQAAFVDYGGNRHGFLAFSEIHPDYYQIPYADRQALLQEQAREEAEQEAAEAAAESAEAEAESAPAETTESAAEPLAETRSSDGPDPLSGEPANDGASDRPAAAAAETIAAPEVSEAFFPPAELADAAVSTTSAESTGAEPIEPSDEVTVISHDRLTELNEPEHVESVGAEDALEEVPERRKPRPRQYKIQEVIKRRQVLLVQVVKEERGNKGAALTTYLSLAGRYSVLMPNTGRGGGISRKITNAADRKRLKAIAAELDVPEGMGVILRTAGASRTKAEVKRDFEYLLRLWENVRELTLRSTAPKLVYEEGSLIKRAIRDLYSREIEQVIVAGEDAYREAKEFMRMLMPSHARHVQLYRDETPIFSRNGVEAQLDAMFSPQVTLRSGGYVVINQTEALVSIDVNSGRSTREHSIEDTALNTNLEAAEEIARQLRLRDLAGLIVIDFIDMEEKRNNRAVERKLKDCLRADRARIQVGRISHFGLLEMSRQRIRTGVLESSTIPCPHCRGTGQVRSISSLSLQILRALEDTLLRHGSHHLHVRTRPEVALYVLNLKRRHLAQLEERFGLTITVSGEAPENGAGFMVERGAPVEDRPLRDNVVPMIAPPADRAEPADIDEESEELEDERESAGERRGRGRRRRRRRGNGDDRRDRYEAGAAAEGEGEIEIEIGEDAQADDFAASETRSASEAEDEGAQERRRRRGRRGGRRRGRLQEGGDFAAADTTAAAEFSSDGEFAPADVSDEEAAAEIGGAADISAPEAVPAPADEPQFGAPEWLSAAGSPDTAEQPTGDGHAEEVAALTDAAGRREEAAIEAEPAPSGAAAAEDAPVPAEAEPASAPEPVSVAEPVAAEAVAAPEAIEDDRPKRSGWWNRRSFL